jgi:hypothetical protein
MPVPKPSLPYHLIHGCQPAQRSNYFNSLRANIDGYKIAADAAKQSADRELKDSSIATETAKAQKAEADRIALSADASIRKSNEDE